MHVRLVVRILTAQRQRGRQKAFYNSCSLGYDWSGAKVVKLLARYLENSSYNPLGESNVFE